MRLIITAALALGMATPAFSGGLQAPTKEPIVRAPIAAPAPARYNWTGPYAGLTLGFGRVTTDGDAPSQDGWGGALHAGYNMDMGTWILGGEVDIAPRALTRLGDDDNDRTLHTSGRLKVRGGAALGAEGRTFAFGTVGAAHVRSSDDDGTYSDTGWLLGVGASHAFQDNMFLTGELLHHRFNDAAGTDASLRGTTATVGVSFRF